MTKNPDPNVLVSHYEKLNSKIQVSNEQHKLIEANMCKLETQMKGIPELERPFTINEIKQSISKLKNGKSCGPDQILNEFLTNGKDALCGPISKLFNIILTSKCFPQTWSIGTISSLYKNGDHLDPNNYRGITLLSCLSKLFPNTLNHRLYTYLKANNLLNKWQGGFLPDHRTSY